MDETDENALKHLFGKSLLKRISDALGEVYPAFDRKKILDLMPRLEPLEMKPRVRFLRDQLREQLPKDYGKALGLLRKSVKTGKLEGFDLWPYTEFVQTFGLEEPGLSLEALAEFTKVFTSEWAVRPFIKLHPDKTMRFLEECARSSEESLRRWASEGTRPRLPWGERLQEFVRDPKPTLPILELLKFDSALYVRKSVANHLNDISKDHPALVVGILKRWKKEAGAEHGKKVDWIIRRSLRTLIKQGHAGGLGLLGVSGKARVRVTGFEVRQKKIKMGERIDFRFEIHSASKKAQKLVVDYIIHFVKANGRTAPKVFKLKNVELRARGKITFEKSHLFKKITTREYYPGEHFIEIQVNGIASGRKAWKLEA